VFKRHSLIRSLAHFKLTASSGIRVPLTPTWYLQPAAILGIAAGWWQTAAAAIGSHGPPSKIPQDSIAGDLSFHSLSLERSPPAMTAPSTFAIAAAILGIATGSMAPNSNPQKRRAIGFCSFFHSLALDRHGPVTEENTVTPQSWCLPCSCWPPSSYWHLPFPYKGNTMERAMVHSSIFVDWISYRSRQQGLNRQTAFDATITS